MEQIYVKAEKLESIIIKNEDPNSFPSDEEIISNIKVEPESDDFLIELYPHFTENASISISKHGKPEQKSIKNEHTSHCSFNNPVPELIQTEIKLEASDVTVKLENLEAYKELKIKKENNNILAEKLNLTMFPSRREQQRRKKGGNFKCIYCEFVTAYIATLKKHILKHENPEEISKFQCYHCKYVTFRKGDLKRHLLNHTNSKEARTFQCDLCRHVTAYKSNLESHFISEHKNQEVGNKLKCDQCGIVTVRKSDLKRHRMRHKKLECDQCEYATIHNYNLQ